VRHVGEVDPVPAQELAVLRPLELAVEPVQQPVRRLPVEVVLRAARVACWVSCGGE